MSHAPRHDRAFGLVISVAALAAVVLLLPLVLTMTPGAVQSALHELDGVLALCAGLLGYLPSQLPPLGLVVLGLTAGTVVLGLHRALRPLASSGRLARERVEIALPARLHRVADRLGIARAVVCCADPRPYAYCAGLLAPRIYVSTGAVAALREPELEAVLLHERHHQARRDPLRVFVGRAAAALLFAVPVVAELQRRFELAKELEADRATLIAHGGRPAALAGALLALGDGMLPFRTGDVSASAWSLTSVRIDQLVDPGAARLPRPSHRAVAVSLATLALAVGLGLGQAARAHLIPAGVLPESAPAAHQCPVPYDGPLL